MGIPFTRAKSPQFRFQWIVQPIDKMVKTTTVVQGRNWKDWLERFLLSYRATLSHFDQFLDSKTSIQQRAQNCVTVTAAQKCQPF
jgi:hypothetical protein